LTAAEVNLGALYITGHGVPLDYVEGYKWLSLAATQGSTSAAQAKQFLRPIMTAKQLAAADDRVAQWRQVHLVSPQDAPDRHPLSAP
jgi:TPR repeat protein